MTCVDANNRTNCCGNSTIFVENIVYDDVTFESQAFNNSTKNVESYHPITYFIETILIPIICIFGLLGNTLSSIVFLRRSLRNSSCNIFLAARGFSDNGFLSTLLIIWISRTFKLHLGTIHGSCQIIIFLTYVCGCTSVWLVVFVTIENYIRICRPFIVNRICTTSVAKIVLGVLWFATVCLYNFPFWAMSPDACIPHEKYHDTVQALVYTDTVITLIVPLICITIVMAAIVCDVIKSYKRRKRLRAPTAKRVANPIAKVTKMLFAVTLSFFLLNLPSHVNRLRLMISSLVSTKDYQTRYTSREEAIQHITLLIYYFSLSTNLIVYVIFGSRFRKMLREMLKMKASVSGNSALGIMGKEQELVPIIESSNKPHITCPCENKDTGKSEVHGSFAIPDRV